jgi:hypothetical protein
VGSSSSSSSSSRRGRILCVDDQHQHHHPYHCNCRLATLVVPAAASDGLLYDTDRWARFLVANQSFSSHEYEDEYEYEYEW